MLLLVSLAATLAGCASGDAFRAAPPRADAALIYIYRPKQYNVLAGLVPNATPHRISVNGSFLVDLQNGGYTSYFAKPGTNTFGSAMKYSHSGLVALANSRKELLRTNLDAGQVYYLRFALGGFGPKLRVVDAATGEREIQHCKLNVEEER
ncbi:MAG: hypothetical protein JWR69_4744 [Pedosphaera sp.]|nr:hypothetical protein [Pedosphaera sp.]